MSGLFKRIILAADIEYEQMVRNFIPLGTEIYIRSKENSKDESTIYDLVKEVVEECNITDKYMCILYSTSVLTTEWHLKQGAQILFEDIYKCVFPIVRQDDDLIISNYSDKSCWYNYDNDKLVAKHADAWFMINIQKILKSGTVIQEENGYIELKDYEAQAVHTKEDFNDLEYKFNARTFNARRK